MPEVSGMGALFGREAVILDHDFVCFNINFFFFEQGITWLPG